jgi:hypothetical protein
MCNGVRGKEHVKCCRFLEVFYTSTCLVASLFSTHSTTWCIIIMFDVASEVRKIKQHTTTTSTNEQHDVSAKGNHQPTTAHRLTPSCGIALAPAEKIPNFVKQYYETSTFHHLSSWRLRIQRAAADMIRSKQQLVGAVASTLSLDSAQQPTASSCIAHIDLVTHTHTHTLSLAV